MDPSVVFIAVAFLVAGTVKGAVGVGLPPIAMGLLVIVMAPVEAAALLVLPSFLTNVWQMLSGPYLRGLVRRTWPLLVCAAVATLSGSDWLTEENARTGTAILGTLLTLYAVTSLVSVRYVLSPATQTWAGPVAGGLTGLATAATGVSSIPVVPYFQSAGLERDELIQAMGLSFTVSTVALTINLARVGAFNLSMGTGAVGAVAGVLVGLWFGRRLRQSVDPELFRKLFLTSLMVLGLYLVARAIS